MSSSHFKLRFFYVCMLGDPHNDPNAQGDAFKTLFVARVVSIMKVFVFQFSTQRWWFCYSWFWTVFFYPIELWYHRVQASPWVWSLWPHQTGRLTCYKTSPVHVWLVSLTKFTITKKMCCENVTRELVSWTQKDLWEDVWIFCSVTLVRLMDFSIKGISNYLLATLALICYFYYSAKSCCLLHVKLILYKN